MSKLILLSALFCAATAQLAAWPGSSYSPYFQALYGPARTPVNSIPVHGQGVAPSYIPAPPPVAAPIFAAPALPAPLPFAASVAIPAPPPFLRGPAYNYAPSPVFSQVGVAPIAPLLTSAVPVLPRLVPAYAPFATSALFIGSNKGRKTA